jgi:hypothetical protein
MNRKVLTKHTLFINHLNEIYDYKLRVWLTDALRLGEEKVVAIFYFFILYTHKAGVLW